MNFRFLLRTEWSEESLNSTLEGFTKFYAK